MGNATSLAPSISGRTKLPSAAGTDGMMNRNTMIAPCSVKTWLYVSAVMMVCFGVSSLDADQQREDAAEEEEEQDRPRDT